MSSMGVPDQIDISSLAGGGGAPPGAAPAGAGAGPPDAGGGAPADPESALSDILVQLRLIANDQSIDPAETAAIDKAVGALQSVLGTRQKETETAMGTTPAHKAMGRATKRAKAGGGGY
jgi:hypothetical protein